jgi:hypothetical protein
MPCARSRKTSSGSTTTPGRVGISYATRSCTLDGKGSLEYYAEVKSINVRARVHPKARQSLVDTNWKVRTGFGFKFGTGFVQVNRGIRSGTKKPFQMGLADTLKPSGTNL